MERRKNLPGKSSALPSDYLKLVTEVFSTNFEAGLKTLAQLKPNPYFEVHGTVYPDELILSVSLIHKDQMAATTVYASCDFDPRASAPSIQDLLARCVDAIGTFYNRFLSSENSEQMKPLTEETLAAFTDIPFSWTPIEIDRQILYLKVDKSNPHLDQMANEWLSQHDPQLKESEKAEQEEMGKLFVTGPKQRKPN